MKINGADEEISIRRQGGCLWIRCSDYPMPPDDIDGFAAEELVLHDNIANLITPTDINCLSAMQFAVDVHRVKSIIVCGHYECRGIKLAMGNCRLEFLGNWLKPIGRTARKYEASLSGIGDQTKRLDALCELNVIEQVVNVCRSAVIGEAWRRGQELSIGGLIYNKQTNLISDLNIRVESDTQLSSNYETAISRFKSRWQLRPDN